MQEWVVRNACSASSAMQISLSNVFVFVLRFISKSLTDKELSHCRMALPGYCKPNRRSRKPSICTLAGIPILLLIRPNASPS